VRAAGFRCLGVWLLLIPSVVALQPAFGGWTGFLPGLAGITLGVLVGYLTGRFRISLLFTVLATLATHLLFGGAVALPRTTIAGFVPTLDTIQRLVLLSVQSWRDLLTVATPADDFTGPAVAPWLLGLVAGVVTATLATRTRAVFWPLLPPPLTLAAGIALGVHTAPTASWLGTALGVGMLAWVWLHQSAAQRADNADILVNHRAETSQTLRRAVAAVALLGVGTCAAITATGITGADARRDVLRDHIAPPLNLRNYPSPLMSYRRYEVEQKDTTLFTVTGMPQGARLRLAVMDTYDGNVFNVSQEANHYLRTGRSITQDVRTNADLQVSVGDYNGVWVPLAGSPRWLEFTGERADLMADGTYFNQSAQQVLATAETGPGDTYRLESSVTAEPTEEQRAELGATTSGEVPLAKLEQVPEIMSSLAVEYSGGKSTAFEQMVAIETKLRTDGYYSDGSKDSNRSRPGHTTERLSTMFQSPILVGDDEQYATAMAIMANQLGIPARVVLGFYPEENPGDVWEVKGTQAHVWVEANFAGVGWVSFNPTPDRDKQPNTEVPRPKPKPKPQIDPPPNPPEKIPEEPVIPDREADDRDGDNGWNINWALVLAVFGVLGGLGVISSPFLVVLGLKARRTGRRRNALKVQDRLVGAWDEIVDRARDLGFQPARSRTRHETAAELQRIHPGVPIAPTAARIDVAVFGPTPPEAPVAEQAWRVTDDIRQELVKGLPWRRRALAALSLRSLRRAKVEPGTGPEEENRDE
jgi:transglutaminase domain protein